MLSVEPLIQTISEMFTVQSIDFTVYLYTLLPNGLVFMFACFNTHDRRLIYRHVLCMNIFLFDLAADMRKYKPMISEDDAIGL
jgi:hypothetical protein